MTKNPTSARAIGAPKNRKRPDPPPLLHVYNKRDICRRAWELARQHREETARRAFDASVGVVCGKITHAKPFAAFLASTPVDISAAMKAAWAESRRHNRCHMATVGAMIVPRHGGALAPLRRRFGRVLPLLVAAARWIGARFIPSRAA